MGVGMTDGEVRVAVVNGYSAVIDSVASVLAADLRLRVVDLGCGPDQDTVGGRVDVAVYDTFGCGEACVAELGRVTGMSTVSRTVVHTEVAKPELIEAAFRRGASGYVARRAGPAGLVDTVARVHGGEKVTVTAAGRSGKTRLWPGVQEGLTEREANVLALIVQGYENEVIAERLFISPNTVKSRIRALYRKIGAPNRVRAAIWGVRHGFEPDRAIQNEEAPADASFGSAVAD